MKLTPAEYHALMSRMKPKQAQPLPNNGVAREADLHEQIFAEVRRRGWVAFHGAMSQRTHRTEGEPDFLIFGYVSESNPDGSGSIKSPRTWLVECKSRTGKLSLAQQAIKYHLDAIGHTVHVVRSFQEFLAVVNG